MGTVLKILYSVFVLIIIISVFPNIISASSQWINEPSLSSERVSHLSFYDSLGNKLYIIGGAVTKNITREDILEAEILLDNNVSTWSVVPDSKLIYPVIWMSGAKANNNIYIFGGYDEVTNSNISIYKSINNIQIAHLSNGQLSTWLDSETKLPLPLAELAAIVYNNKLFISGGGKWDGVYPDFTSFDHPEINSRVFSYGINADGSLTLQNDLGLLPEPLLGHSMLSVGSKIFLFGGVDSNYSASNKVFYTDLDIDINNDGTIKEWHELSNRSLPLSIYNFMSIQIDGYILILGGRGPTLHGSITYDNVYYSKIAEDGSLGPWQESVAKLPKPTCCAGIATNGDNIYITGGHDGAVYFDTVWKASIWDIVGLPSPTIIPTPTDILPTPVPTIEPTVEPTVIPTIVPTVIPSPTSVPNSNNIVVFVPGMGACWNYDAITHNLPRKNSDWYLNSFDDTYTGLIASLESAGYHKNENYYIYCYDWRKNIQTNGNDLGLFISDLITKSPTGTKFDLVGHSMGGLVARSAANDSSKQHINQIITVGSPNHGSAMAYGVWEAADFTDAAGLGTTMMQLVLRLQSKTFDNQVDVVRNSLPSIQNILPLWNILKDKFGNTTYTSSLTWQNNFLPGLNNNYNNLLGITSTISGKGQPTLQYLQVTPRDRIDQLFNNWVDGKPINRLSGDGDNAVLISSSQISGVSNNFEIENANHGDIVAKSAGQAQILHLLNTSGTTFNTNPRYYYKSVVVSIQSPATFTVTGPSGILSSVDGLLLIDNPNNGKYCVKLSSTKKGDFGLLFGRINNGDTAWDEEEGTFNKSGLSTTYCYQVDFTRKDLGRNPLLDALERISNLQKEIKEGKNRNEYYKNYSYGSLEHLEQGVNNLLKNKVKKNEEQIINLLKDINNSLTGLHIWQFVCQEDKANPQVIAEQMRIIKSDVEEYIGNL